MALVLDTQVKNTMLGSLQTLFDGGTLEIWEDSDASGIPAGPDTANTGDTLLSTVTLPATGVFDAPSGGSMSATAANLNWTDSNGIDASGTAQYFRIKSSDATQAMQGGVGTAAGSDLQVDTTSFVMGGSFEITGFTLNL